MAKEDAKIIIGGDAQRAVKSLQDVSKNLGGLGNSVSSFMGTATGFLNWQTAAIAGAGALGSAFAKLMSDAIDTADQMANMSKRTGIAVESLSKLSYVAKMSDTSMETLQRSMKFLNTSLYDASKGNETAIKKFEEFGVAVYNADGTIKNAEQTIYAVADAYVKLDNEAAKTKLATELFGKAGQELMPMLSEGGAGIKALTDEAQRMGVVVSTETAKSMEELNDKLDKMKTFAAGVATQVLEDLVPSLSTLTTEMDEFNSTGAAVSDTANVISTAFEYIGKAATNLSWPLRQVIDLIGQFDHSEKTIRKKGVEFEGPDPSDLRNPFVTVNSPMDNMMGKAYQAAKDRFLKTGSYYETPKKTKGGSGGGNSKTNVEEDFPIVTDYWKIQDQALANYIAQLDTNSLIQNELNRSPFEGDGDTAFYYQSMSAQLEFIDSSKAAWTGYFDDIQVGFLDHMNALGSDYGQALGGIASMFESFANTSVEQQGILFDISKAFRAAEIISSTWSTAQKAYEWGMGAGGPILGGIFMASAIATGIGNLTSLLSTQPGQTSISGGGVAPVPNFAQRNPQGGNGGGGTKNIKIVFEGFIWDKDRLAREIVPAINRAISDGVGR